jgi:hypothetical protein
MAPPNHRPETPDFYAVASRWLQSWKAFDPSGPETIPRISEQQLRELTASLEALLLGAYARGRDGGGE